MVLQLPIPNKSTGQADDSSSNASNSVLHSYNNRDVSATPIISNLASGVYPIGSTNTSEFQRLPNLPPNNNINKMNLQQQQQQQHQLTAASSLQYPPSQIMQSSLTQQLQPQMQYNSQLMMGNNTANAYANPSLYNFNATQIMMMSQYNNQQMIGNPQQVAMPTSNNTGINSSSNIIMSPWMRLGGQPKNPLGKVTVGGRSLLNATMNTKNGNGDGSKNSKSLLGGRGRMEGPPPRPPPLPTKKAELSPTKTMANRLQPTPSSKVVNFEELPVSDIEDGANNNEGDVQEAVLTTELLTLSVHEALTFDGVELALHPDLFKESNRNKDHTSGRALGLQPGDLVEIRVWSARPSVTAAKPKSNSITSKSGGKTSLHSRNTSLASANSSIYATASQSEMPTRSSLINANSSTNLTRLEQTPVPSEVFGDPKSSLMSTLSGITPVQPSNSESPGILLGERILDAPPTNQGTTVATSSLLAGAASNLFRNTNKTSDIQSPSPTLVPRISVPSLNTSVSSSESGQLHATSLDDSTIASHSRDSSLLTSSTLTGIHSRDSSLIAGLHSRDSSLLNPLSNNSSPTKVSPLNSPLAGTSFEAVAGQAHPLINNLSLHSLDESHKGLTFPTRRDGPSLLTPPAMPPPLQSQTGTAARPETITTSSSTPLATTPTSTYKSSANNNKSPSSKSPSQRPPVALPREQSKDANNNKQGRLFSDSIVTSHARNDSISSTTPAPSGGMTGATSQSHRRYSSSIPASSSSIPLLPPAHRNNNRLSINSGMINRDNSEDDVAIDVLESLQETHFVRTSFVMPVSDESLKSIKSSARTKVSLLRRVADLYQITGFDTVTVTQVPKRDIPYVQQQISADFVTITFKDQFVSRGDMFYFQRSFVNNWVYESKRLSFNGIRTNTKVIRHGDHIIRSGIISEDTKLTFRSRSARIIWLVQMSSEMWDFSSPYKAVGNQKKQEPSCETYFNKFISFARKLFEKWKKLEVTHNLTVVFFSRTFIRHKEVPLSNTASAVHTNSDGRMYCDNYKIVLNNAKADWNSLIYRIKQAFVNYPREVKWDLTPGMERIPSTAGQGNILEAVNMTLNLLHLHYIDRDLHRTGNSIVIMTAGNGVFEVEKDLAGITKQRMMDNGIGSDMLSLGLPPLHVIPFFLFRNENRENTAEEMQGFDDDGGATSSFEVPHWMNLSYVDYDDEEEAMLYKEHINDDADDVNDEQGENDANATPWIVSNGFLRRNKPIHHDESTPISFPTSDVAATAKDHVRHLISQRGFEDILQACRPRNRGEYGSGLPASLSNLLKAFSPDVYHSMHPSEQMIVLDQAGRLSPQRTSSRAKNLEWGAVSFDEFNMSKVSSSLQRSQSQFHRLSTSLSDSSSASSFASIGSQYKSMSGMHLQSTTSLTLETGQTSTLHGDDSLASLDIDGENPQEDNGNHVSMIERMMREHDEHAFSGRSGRVSPTNSFANRSFNSGIGGSLKIEGSPPLARSQSAMLPSLLSKGGGIEAALAQYDDPPDPGVAKKPGIDVPASSDKRLSTSPIISTMPFTFSLDRRNEGYNPNYTRHGQEKVTAIAEGLQPFDFHRRNLSKGLGDRRSSFAHGSTKQQVTADSLSGTPLHNPMIRKKSIKHSYQHRYRRKVWVLNPFRQEDEDEVLAKRTHNRRRWSHVFPLGEAEFKKHAGPNWKSLCQPAILPMTIDFHPDPAELQDQDKFKIKQYSVLLPSTNETNYMDATELLDDLMVQRIRQDFQLVPRSILSAHRENDNTTEHTLSRTLSMGHKIQKLSYNPSSDSVDVVQYYANFAENESPQSYRYLLWSALRQDYVSVVQTFTKYTSPYKWNVLDMLLSGDAIKSISEEMRHPRISFLILPDPFTDQKGESEYSSKFQRLVEYFNKLQSKGSSTIEVETLMTSDKSPYASKGKRSFIVDLRRRSDKYEWCEIVLDSNCDTRRTFRVTIQWLVAIGSKIDNQQQLLHRRCAQYGLNLIRVPSYSSLSLCFMNPFAVPITIPVRNKSCVDSLEKALTNDFDFVYDDSHMADPNELVDFLDGFDFSVNRWSMNRRKKFVPAKQYLHRTGTLFVRLLRDTQDKAIVIIFLNNLYISGDEELMECARTKFVDVEQFITAECKKAGC